MPNFKRQMAGGTSVTGGPLRPHGNRAGTGQASSYWRAVGLTFNIATGGNTLTNYTEGGVQYRSHTFTSSGTFSLTAQGTEPACDIFVQGGGGSGVCTNNGRGFGDGSGGSGGFATSTMILPATTYQVTVGGVSGTSSFGVSTSLITANGGSGAPSECEFCCAGGGSGGSASVTGALGTNNVTFTGLNGTGGCSCSGASNGRSNTYQDGTTRYYGGQRDGSYYGCSGCQAAVNAGGGGQGGHTNCGCNGGGAAGVVIVRYKFVP